MTDSGKADAERGETGPRRRQAQQAREADRRRGRQEGAGEMTDPLVAQLVAARRAAGWTQKQLADAMRCGQSHVSMLESGRTGLQMATLRRWAQALGLQPALVPVETALEQLTYRPETAPDPITDAYLSQSCDCDAHRYIRAQIQDPGFVEAWNQVQARQGVGGTLDVAEATVALARGDGVMSPSSPP